MTMFFHCMNNTSAFNTTQQFRVSFTKHLAKHQHIHFHFSIFLRTASCGSHHNTAYLWMQTMLSCFNARHIHIGVSDGVRTQRECETELLLTHSASGKESESKKETPKKPHFFLRPHAVCEKPSVYSVFPLLCIENKWNGWIGEHISQDSFMLNTFSVIFFFTRVFPVCRVCMISAVKPIKRVQTYWPGHKIFQQ